MILAQKEEEASTSNNNEQRKIILKYVYVNFLPTATMNVEKETKYVNRKKKHQHTVHSIWNYTKILNEPS